MARRVADTLLAREGTGAAWGIEIEEAREGYARIAMTVRADMLNGHGIAHGGMIFALADTAFAYACNSRNVTTRGAAARRSSFWRRRRQGDRAGRRSAARSARAGRSGVYRVSVRTAERRGDR